MGVVSVHYLIIFGLDPLLVNGTDLQMMKRMFCFVSYLMYDQLEMLYFFLKLIKTQYLLKQPNKR